MQPPPRPTLPGQQPPPGIPLPPMPMPMSMPMMMARPPMNMPMMAPPPMMMMTGPPPMMTGPPPMMTGPPPMMMTGPPPMMTGPPPMMMTAPPSMMTAPPFAPNVVSKPASATIIKPPASTVGQTVAAASAPVLRTPMTLPLGIGITQVVSAPPTGWSPMVSASGPHPPESRVPLALFVTKIPEKMATEKLKRIFEAFGQLVKFVRPLGSNDKPKACAVATFSQGIYALRCLQHLPLVDLIEGEESKIQIHAGTNETNVLNMLDTWEKSAQRTSESDIERAYTIIKNILSEPIIIEETVTIPVIAEGEESVAAALGEASELIIDDINYDPTTNSIVMNEIERFRARLALREKEVEAQKLIRINEIITRMEKEAIEKPMSKNQESSGHFMESLGFTKPREDDRNVERDREREREREKDRCVERARDRNTENSSLKRSNESNPEIERENARRRLEVLESLGANTQSSEVSKPLMSLEAPLKLGLTLTKKKTTLAASGFGANDDDQVKPMRQLITLDDYGSLEKKQQLATAQAEAISKQLAEAMKK